MLVWRAGFSVVSERVEGKAREPAKSYCTAGGYRQAETS